MVELLEGRVKNAGAGRSRDLNGRARAVAVGAVAGTNAVESFGPDTHPER